MLYLKALLGAFVVWIIVILSKSKNYFIAGLIPLFPTFAMIAHFIIFYEQGITGLKETILFGIVSLLPYMAYLLVLYILILKQGLFKSLLWGLFAWGTTATVVITWWNAEMSFSLTPEHIMGTLAGIFIFFGYAFAFNRMLWYKTANGISRHSYIFAIISSLVILSQAENNFVKMVFSLELIFAIIGLVLVLYFHNKLKYREEDFTWGGTIATFFSIFGIMGVSKAIKSFTKRKIISKVSLNAYLCFLMAYLSLTVVVESQFVLIAISISSLMFIYTIIQTVLSNEKITKGNIVK